MSNPISCFCHKTIRVKESVPFELVHFFDRQEDERVGVRVFNMVRRDEDDDEPIRGSYYHYRYPWNEREGIPPFEPKLDDVGINTINMLVWRIKISRKQPNPPEYAFHTIVICVEEPEPPPDQEGSGDKQKQTIT
jgi:hypothetical protein